MRKVVLVHRQDGDFSVCDPSGLVIVGPLPHDETMRQIQIGEKGEPWEVEGERCFNPECNHSHSHGWYRRVAEEK